MANIISKSCHLSILFLASVHRSNIIEPLSDIFMDSYVYVFGFSDTTIHPSAIVLGVIASTAVLIHSVIICRYISSSNFSNCGPNSRISIKPNWCTSILFFCGMLNIHWTTLNIIFFRKTVRKCVARGTQNINPPIPLTTRNTYWQLTSPTPSVPASQPPKCPYVSTPGHDDHSDNASVESFSDHSKLNTSHAIGHGW